ncbi:MAG: ABC transporter substrate-binding protein [Dysgonomonas sp.]
MSVNFIKPFPLVILTKGKDPDSQKLQEMLPAVSMTKRILLILVFILSLSCSQTQKKSIEDTDGYELRYAKGFSVKVYDDYRLVTVHDPWDTTRTLFQYILVDRNKEIPSDLPKGTIVKVPLESVIAFSTIQCSMLQEINEQHKIKGVCQAQYIDLPYIQEKLKSGEILDLGSMHKPDVERLIQLMPSGLVVSAMETGMGYLEKLKIPVIVTTDYMENTALGRAEWIRYHALFYGKEQMADSLFSETERRYNEIRDKVKNADKKPTVFNDLKFGKTWRIAGGQSYLANLIRDAGGEYVWNDSSTGSRRLAGEMVLDEAGTADIWLLKYNRDNDFTYSSLEKESKIYSQFGAYKNKHIWGCNTGRIHYFEDIPIHPDSILRDMAIIFQPQLFPHSELSYFKPLE